MRTDAVQRVSRAVGAFLLLQACVACNDVERYRIELEVYGDGLRRSLLCCQYDEEGEQVGPVELPEERVHALQGIYTDSEHDCQEHHITGVVRGQQGNGHDGSIVFERLHSPLGDHYLYSERFFGNDDIHTDLERRLEAAERMAELIELWLSAELGDERGIGSLVQWCRSGLRDDLGNLAVMLWSDGLIEPYRISGDVDDSEIFGRIVHFLCDRGYIELAPETLSTLSRLLLEDEDGERALAWLLGQILAERAGQAQPPEAFDFLNQPEKVAQSLQRALENTPEYAALLEEWQEGRRADDDGHKPEPDEVLEELAETLTGDYYSSNSRIAIDMSLSMPVKPESSNGRYDADLGTLSWKDSIRTGRWSKRLPVYFYAVWIVPNDEFQQSHFGRTLLDGDDLSELCVWSTALSPTQRREFDAFLESLTPTSDLEARVSRFRFSGSAADEASDFDSGGRKILLHALGQPSQ